MSDLRPRGHRVAGPSPVARHGRLRRTNPWLLVLRWTAAAMAVVLVSAACVGGYALWKLQDSIKTVTLVGETVGPPPELGALEGGFNVLIVGSDRCEDPKGCKDRSTNLNDVTMLLHVSHDQTNAVAVSFPRDLVVPIPSCPNPKGGSYSGMSAQPINVTLFYGGLPCTVLTVEALTGLKVQFAAEVSFSGVARLSSAIGGVPVCINGPVIDHYSGLYLPKAGEYTLSGTKALAFLRTRHGVGDGSDLGRISSQQVFLSSLVRTVKSDGVLNDFGKLYNIATVASQSMTLSNSLKNLNTMVSMAQVLKNLPLERVMFVQYPGVTGQPGVYAGKVAPVTALAEALFAKIKADKPFTLEAGNTGLGSVENPDKPSASPDPTASETPAPSLPPASLLPGIKGQSAADYTCSKAFG
ncbi:LCP family protein required for cell wall assembly [Cryobacterium mesophilum]|uniref:LytR family transcriptional regulator n=1 Tax=Terrimesophilobacter mesophilus TaxID=433647 RepID=A0A4R8VCF7_9MICO|nr:LCP family protein [Terrimesophilobacter mesophilus]MBB5632985.1 LCP family protein required for cell wall assembly [Terrimesophilobacter mesophilus]TFB79752.1 LytR family transcriptional regulator [Terrimesophilobacter mesophilus]